MNLSAQNYRAWLVSAKDFPRNTAIEEKIAFLARYGILAPSTHNTQPWIFRTEANILRIKPDFSRSLPAADPLNRGMYLSLGACAENILQASVHFGLAASVRADESGVEITFQDAGAEPTDDSVLHSIQCRHSNKGVYLNKRIPPQVIRNLRDINQNGIKMKIITTSEDLKSLMDIHIRAAKNAADSPDFVRELTKWLRINTTRSSDGMPGFVAGNSLLGSLVGKTLLKTNTGLFKKAVKRERALLESTPAVVVFGVDQDTPESWITCGRAMEDFWLRLTDCGLVAHPLTASVNQTASVRELEAMTRLNARPVFLMRLGYATKTDLRTPRRSV